MSLNGKIILDYQGGHYIQSHASLYKGDRRFDIHTRGKNKVKMEAETGMLLRNGQGG